VLEEVSRGGGEAVKKEGVGDQDRLKGRRDSEEGVETKKEPRFMKEREKSGYVQGN